MDAAPADSFVSSVERRLRSAVELEAGSGGVLGEAAGRACLAGGKRFRPRLVHLLGSACSAPPRALEDVAAAAELIHSASLLHDDVVDEGRLRRGLPTANAAWGNAVAVLAGDFLLSTAFSLLEPHPHELTTEAIALVAEMSRSAINEVEGRGSIGLSLEDWRAIAEGKTGALFAWCGQASARLAGRPELSEPFASFGRRLGVAFQLADDLADLKGGAGKDRFSDLASRNPSFPLLLAARRSPELAERIASAWAAAGVGAQLARELGEAVLGSGAVEESGVALRMEVEAAIACLPELPGTAWPEALESLARSLGLEAG